MQTNTGDGTRASEPTPAPDVGHTDKIGDIERKREPPALRGQALRIKSRLDRLDLPARSSVAPRLERIASTLSRIAGPVLLIASLALLAIVLI